MTLTLSMPVGPLAQTFGSDTESVGRALQKGEKV